MRAHAVSSTLRRPLGLVVALAAALLAVLLSTTAARAVVWTMTAELTAAAETPTPGPDGATGSAFITIDDETNEVCFELAIDGIAGDDSVTAAHIHEGAEGVAGDVVVPLFTEPPTGEMTGCVQDVDAGLIAAILGDPTAYYVNIHTVDFPAGAVRGQLVVNQPSGDTCQVTVEPSTVRVGEEFVVSGNFGGAEIHIVEGENAALPEDSEPVATVPQDEASFALTFTAEAGDEGTWTVWAFIFATECGDSAILTIQAALPDTAAQPSEGTPAGHAATLAAGLLFIGLVGLLGYRLRTPAPR
jgi:hypothetical protein